MYINTATVMMNKAGITLDFFEPVNGFVAQPHANEQCHKKKYCEHIRIFFFPGCHIDAKMNHKYVNNC